MSVSGHPRRTWSRWIQIPWVCADRRNLGQSVAAAVIVGSILFLINQSDAVFGGHATAATWLKISLSYLVPFFVSNFGIGLRSRRSAPD